MILSEKMEQCLWIAHKLFERNRTSGTTGNISFLHEDCMYITASGTCFGTLNANQLCRISMVDGMLKSGQPSKEWPLHQILYHISSDNQAVVHTHGFYSTLWSCLPCENSDDSIPAYTPYLRMKADAVRYIPYAKPGSTELFMKVKRACTTERKAYLLGHHGAVCAGTSLMDAFGLIEELEESAHLAWCLREQSVKKIEDLS